MIKVRFVVVVYEKKVTMNIVGGPFAKTDKKFGLGVNEVMFFVFMFKLAANVAAYVRENGIVMNEVNAAHGVAGHFGNDSVTFVWVSG